jgi:hypothetical protein
MDHSYKGDEREDSGHLYSSPSSTARRATIGRVPGNIASLPVEIIREK